MYFNKKYKRVGKLFQGVYKAVLIESDEQLLYLSKYIHLNPFKYKLDITARKIDIQSSVLSQPSSYPNFIGKINQNWILPKDILSFYRKGKTEKFYKNFIESAMNRKSNINPKILIDEDD